MLKINWPKSDENVQYRGGTYLYNQQMIDVYRILQSFDDNKNSSVDSGETYHVISDNVNNRGEAYRLVIDDENNKDNRKNTVRNISSETHRVISINGDRGSGKSTFMYQIKSFMDNISSNEQSFSHVQTAKKLETIFSHSIHAGERENTNLTEFALQKHYLTLPVLTPSTFTDKISILENLIAAFSKYVEDIEAEEKDDIDTYQIRSLIEESAGVISKLRLRPENTAEQSTAQRYLKDTKDKINLSKRIDRVTEEILALSNTLRDRQSGKLTDIVIFVDDLDLLDSKNINRALNDVANVLAETHITILLSFKRKQMIQAVENSFLKDAEVSYKEKFITSSDIQEEAEDFLGKLCPRSQEITLFEVGQLTQFTIKDILGPFIDYSSNPSQEELTQLEKTVEKWFEYCLSNDFNIILKPQRTVENYRWIMGLNLRELIQSIKFFYENKENHALFDVSVNIEKIKSLQQFFLGLAERRLNAKQVVVLKLTVDDDSDSLIYDILKSLKRVVPVEESRLSELEVQSE